MNNKVMVLTPFFSPNIGGVETHLDDLVKELDKKNYIVYVQTYSPLTTDIKYKNIEKIGKNINIRRYKWFGKDLFHKLEKYPILDFLYLTPYLFIRVFLFLLKNRVDVIHSQGLNATLIGLILKIFFNFKLISSTHAVYEVDKNSITAKLVKFILNRVDKVLCLSKASKNELLSFDIKESKIDLFKYWIDLNNFKKLDKILIRKELNIKDKFTILFVGRLIEKKGVKELIEVAKRLKDIEFVFIGVGPLEEFVKTKSREFDNIVFLGKIANSELGKYYNIADIFCIPSQYEEGFGRVVMEAVACGVPVIGSNFGGLSEALDESVSILFKPSIQNLEENIIKLYKNRGLLIKMSENCIEYANKNFSAKNIETITRYY